MGHELGLNGNHGIWTSRGKKKGGRRAPGTCGSSQSWATFPALCWGGVPPFPTCAAASG